jgi:hypothetical protein
MTMKTTVATRAADVDCDYALVAHRRHGDPRRIFYRPAAIETSDHAMRDGLHPIRARDPESDATSGSMDEMRRVIDWTDGG